MTTQTAQFQIQTPCGPVQIELNDEGFTSVKFIAPSMTADQGNQQSNSRADCLRIAKPIIDTRPKEKRLEITRGLESLSTLHWINHLPLVIQGTPFQNLVWNALLSIPSGHTKSYRWLAQAIGKPSATRAVANACGANPLAYFIPCHRIVRSDGKLGGYRWGIETKRFLLDHESRQKKLPPIQ